MFPLLDNNSHSVSRRVPGGIEKEALSEAIERASRLAMQAVVDKFDT